MPANKPREEARKDIWLTRDEIKRLEEIAIVMREKGIDASGRNGKTNYSKVIRWLLQNTDPLNIGG
jgi:hypothetical protein